MDKDKDKDKAKKDVDNNKWSTHELIGRESFDIHEYADIPVIDQPYLLEKPHATTQQICLATANDLILQQMYNKMDLNEQQKRDFHVLLVRLSTVHDLIKISKQTYNDIKDTICCPDKRCLCEPKPQTGVAPKKPVSSNYYASVRTFGKNRDDYEYNKLIDFKKQSNEMSKMHIELCKYKEIIKHEDDEHTSFSDTIDMYKDLAYHKSVLSTLQQKLQPTMY